MPDHNDPPILWNDPAPVLKIDTGGDVESYEITPVDITMLAAVAAHEDRYPYVAIWAILQRFASFWQNRKNGLNRRRPGALTSYCQDFSAPLNPTFAFTFRPEPSRAVVGTDCAALGRRLTAASNGRRTYNWTGRGRSPRPTGHSTGIPKRPRISLWNQIMCASGAGGGMHGSDGRGARRARLFAKVRDAIWGSSDDIKRSNYHNISLIRLGGGPPKAPDECRLAVWNICHGQAGNPVPGFDNWAACSKIDNKSNKIELQSLDPSARQAALNRVAAHAREQGYPRRGNRRPQRIPVRLGEGRGSNCFQYHSYMLEGQTIWIEWNDGSRIFDSRRAEIDMNHSSQRSSGPLTAASGGGRGAGSISSAGGVVPATSDGLAPTQQRPASSQSRTTQQSQLDTKEELYRQLEEWSTNMQTTLNREVGRGFTRR